MTESNASIGKRKIKKIIVDRDLCIGAASCVAMAGGTFELDEENKAVVKLPAGDNDEKILLAAKSCPVFAITLEDEDGKRVYPEDEDTTGGEHL
ncbi:MAG: ferredoxin [Candidatus Kerfeldbacteria bacterium]|nr:ferredoxin [Candidatus Kerfeldbacteria bacterium]